eukprot:1360830-Pleurochrysis_carterae.AAC.1
MLVHSAARRGPRRRVRSPSVLRVWGEGCRVRFCVVVGASGGEGRGSPPVCVLWAALPRSPGGDGGGD